MAVELIVAPEAQQDIEEAYGWYEQRRPGLGEDFLSCVDAGIQTICRLPLSYPQIYEEYRRALVRRFPFAVFYEYTSGVVYIYSIFHTSQNPDKWRIRLI
ncbi:MAG: type II toxin-antitoxin system RelE/ParE family toxin [Desulfobulbaceae bacterium]|nr:type II toxin-antitoxin system RelE/ParE family toxin [Desulfobulbaceae bacterium]